MDMLGGKPRIIATFTPDIKYNIDLIIYSESIIRNLLQNVVDVYMSCFNNYSFNVDTNKKTLVGLSLASICILIISYIFFFYFYVHKAK